MGVLSCVEYGSPVDPLVFREVTDRYPSRIEYIQKAHDRSIYHGQLANLSIDLSFESALAHSRGVLTFALSMMYVYEF